MADPDKIIDPPGHRPEAGGIIDEEPLPAPPALEEVRSTRRGPISPDDPLVSEPLGALVPNDAVSAGIPNTEPTESPHDPARSGDRPRQPGQSAEPPEVPPVPDAGAGRGA